MPDKPLKFKTPLSRRRKPYRLQKLPKGPLATAQRTPNADRFLSIIKKLDLESTLANRLNAAELERVAKETAPEPGFFEQFGSSAKREVKELGQSLGSLGTALAMPPPGETRLGLVGKVAKEIPGAVVQSLKQTFTTSPIETLRTRPIAGISDIALGLGTGAKVLGVTAKGAAAVLGGAAASGGALRMAEALSKVGTAIEGLDPVLATLRLTGKGIQELPLIGEPIKGFVAAKRVVQAERQASRGLATESRRASSLRNRFVASWTALDDIDKAAYADYALKPEVRAAADYGTPFRRMFLMERDLVEQENRLLGARFKDFSPRSLESISPSDSFLEVSGPLTVAMNKVAIENAPTILKQGLAGGGRFLTRDEAIGRHVAEVFKLAEQVDTVKRIAREAAKRGEALTVKLDDPRLVRTAQGIVSADPKYIVLMPSSLAKGLEAQGALSASIIQGIYESLSPQTLEAIEKGLLKSVTPDMARAIERATQAGMAGYMAKLKLLGPKAFEADTHAFLIPTRVKDALLKEFGFYITQRDALVSALDALLSVWKIATLALYPAWVVSNAVGSSILSILAGVSPAAHAKILAHSVADILDTFSKATLGRKATAAIKGKLEKAGAAIEREGLFKGSFSNPYAWVEDRIAAAKSLVPDEVIRSGATSFEATTAGKAISEKFPGLPKSPYDVEIIPKWVRESKVGQFFGERVTDIFQFNAAVEDHFRKAAFVSEAAREASKQAVLASGKPVYDYKNILKTLLPQVAAFEEPTLLTMRELAINPEFLSKAIPKVEEFFGGYLNLTTVERVKLKRLIPFYSWVRHINLLALTLPFKHPIRASVLRGLLDIYREERVNPNAPDWVKGAIPAGVTMTPGGPKLKFITITGTNIFFGLGRLEQSINPFIKFGIERLTGRDIFRDFQAFQDPDVFINPTNGKAFRRTPTGLEEILVTPPFLSHFLRIFPQMRLIEDILTPALRYSGSGILDPKIRGEINKEIETLSLRIGSLRLKATANRIIDLPEDFDKITDDWAELQAAEAKFERLKALRSAGDISAYQRDRFSTVLGALGLKEFSIFEDDLKRMIEKNQMENLHGVLAKALKDPDLRLRIWEAVDRLLRQRGDILPVFKPKIPTKAGLLAPSTE